MSKITNDGLTRSGTGCFIHVDVPKWQQWASKGQTERVLCTTHVCLYSVLYIRRSGQRVLIKLAKQIHTLTSTLADVV